MGDVERREGFLRIEQNHLDPIHDELPQRPVTPLRQYGRQVSDRCRTIVVSQRQMGQIGEPRVGRYSGEIEQALVNSRQPPIVVDVQESSISERINRAENDRERRKF